MQEAYCANSNAFSTLWQKQLRFTVLSDWNAPTAIHRNEGILLSTRNRLALVMLYETQQLLCFFQTLFH